MRSSSVSQNPRRRHVVLRGRAISNTCFAFVAEKPLSALHVEGVTYYLPELKRPFAQFANRRIYSSAMYIFYILNTTYLL
jgi:hypothetical protein